MFDKMFSGVQVAPPFQLVMYQHQRFPYVRYLQILPENICTVDLVFKIKILGNEYLKV